MFMQEVHFAVPSDWTLQTDVNTFITIKAVIQLPDVQPRLLSLSAVRPQATKSERARPICLYCIKNLNTNNQLDKLRSVLIIVPGAK